MPDNRCTHCPGSHTGELSCHASATAKARAWLLIEHPGPWAETVDDTAAGPVADAVRRARRHGVRPQFIRRPARRRATPPLRVFTAFPGGAAGGSGPWLEGREVADAAELDDLDLAAVAAGRAPGFGSPLAGPLVLVCTHGRHNVCCAAAGAPLARLLGARFGDAVWETTHLGGDRYAANLACLPHGLYYGAMDDKRATAAVEAYARGEVALERFRGRAGLSEPAQAAEHFVREHTGVTAVDGVRVESAAGDTAIVRCGGDLYRVRVERRAEPPCGPDCSDGRATYVKRDLALLNRARLV